MDGDNKSFLLVHNELIVAWIHGDNVYLYTSVESMIRGYCDYKVV